MTSYVRSDKDGGGDDGGEVASAPLAGDLAAILSALFYGLDAYGDRILYQTCESIGIFYNVGFVWIHYCYCGICPYIENRQVEQEEEQSQDTDHIILLWALYILYFNYFYNALSFFLQCDEATLLALSLQITQMWWATLISIWFQHVIPTPLFYVAVSLTISGV